MPLTFKGGVNVHEYKHAHKMPVERFDAPEFVHIPMSQHIGAHCIPCVKAGDIVDKGQLIGAEGEGLSCPIHSSVSGKVISIERKMMQTTGKTDFITIQNDFAERISPQVNPFNKRINETTFEEIVDVVRRAGIAGMGGATFPTHAKMQSAKGRVKTLIINAAECEPFLTANHRLMLEAPEKIINGMKVLLKAFNLQTGYIAIEDNKLNAVEAISEAAAMNKMVDIRVLKTKYPQGDERQLIYALTGKELQGGKLPADVGCVVFNVETCSAVCEAFISGMPLIERIVTVDGDCVVTPKNLLVPVGTPMSLLIEYCGLKKKPEKIIAGGPMMGVAVWDADAPVTKSTSGVLAFSKNKIFNKSSECIHCGKCVEGCPMRLMPAYLAAFSKKEDYESCEKYDVMSCVECGCCTYICPASVQIVQKIRVAKGRIQDDRRRAVLVEEAKKAKIEESKEYHGRSAAAGREIGKEKDK